MKWGTLKNAVRDLGFEDDTVYSDPIVLNTVISAANRAIKYINQQILPKTSSYEITQDGEGAGYRRIDLSALGDFSGIYGTPTIETEDNLSDFSDYRIEQDHVIVLNESIKGTMRFFYRKQPEVITTSTHEDTVLDVLPEVDILLPLLTAHYVWLDDDTQKATIYWNEFDQLKNEILTKYNTDKMTVKGTIYGGIAWHS